MAKIVCTGMACLDYLFKVQRLPEGGGKFFATNYRAAPGGPAAAAGIAVAALGHEPVFIGRLGDDQVGRDILRHLQDRGVDISHVKLVTDQTSQVSSVIIEDTGERQIINYSSSSLDPDPDWIDKQHLAGADFLLTDVRWPEGTERALRLARELGIPSLIDADIAPVDISGLADLATYTIFSERGLEMVSGLKDLEAGLARITDSSSTWPAVTSGEKGSYWLKEGKLHRCPAESIEAVDTCGAGDVFHGAFAVAMAEQKEIDEAMRFAGVVAALKCQSFGGSLGVPNRTAVDSYLSSSRF
ncbi:MAG: ribokinase [Desulfofustis sp.]|nr:ribokinase [Desulfofustis sp.]